MKYWGVSHCNTFCSRHQTVRQTLLKFNIDCINSFPFCHWRFNYPTILQKPCQSQSSSDLSLNISFLWSLSISYHICFPICPEFVFKCLNYRIRHKFYTVAYNFRNHMLNQINENIAAYKYSVFVFSLHNRLHLIHRYTNICSLIITILWIYSTVYCVHQAHTLYVCTLGLSRPGESSQVPPPEQLISIYSYS